MNDSQNAKQTVWIGLDVDSKYVVAAIDEPWVSGPQRIAPRFLPTQSFVRSEKGMKEMLSWARKNAGNEVQHRVIMESTGSYSEDVHRWLWKVAPETGPAITNPKIMKDFLKSLDPRTKSDRVDSQGIARFGADRSPSPTPLLSEKDLKLRGLMRTRELLIGDRDGLANRLRTTRDKTCRSILESAIKDLQKRIDQALRKARQLVERDEQKKRDFNRLVEVFAVGEITALVILAELGDLRRFKSAGHLASYCGLTPKVEGSGEKNKIPRVSKFGNHSIRRALYMSALVVIRHRCTDLADWYARAVERGMHSMKAIVHLMRKLLDRMYLMITTDRRYERYPQKCAQGVVNK